ncbi:MAG: 2-oxoisovalerate dehydrogenase E1 subunit beta [Armatimonadetes bacterium]|nr:2-oxoisovalerate dehydrogenase E1 subunit beta [Armatimonadota bacterium]
METTMELIFLVEEDAEGGWNAKGLGEAIFTQAETLDALRVAIRDAVSCHFDVDKSPKIIRLHIVRDEVLTA